MIGLPEFDVEVAALGGLARKRLDVLERGVTIGLRLTGTEQIEIGAVEHVNGLRHGWSSPGGVPLYRDLMRKGEAAIPQKPRSAKATGLALPDPQRSEERRVGKEC